MKILSSASDISENFSQLVDKAKKIHFAVAWASCGFDACQKLLSMRHKIKRGVVSLDFYQTDPDFIEEFNGKAVVKFIRSSTGVFHPKVYFFEMAGGAWECLLGSANFTAGGFGRNREMMVHFAGGNASSDEIARDICQQIHESWEEGIPASNIDLDRYRYWQNQSRRSLKYNAKTLRPDAVDLLNKSWPDFCHLVCSETSHQIEPRLRILSVAHDSFVKYGSLQKMPQDLVKGIAGLIQSDEMPWAWFGNMNGAGVYKNLINTNLEGFSRALDEIPLTGQVTKEDYNSYIERYISIYPTKDGIPIRHGLGTATRFLAMKRPDYFVGLNTANRQNLSAAFGIKIKNHDYNDYWDWVVEPICQSKWWTSRRPRVPLEREVWDGRSALLDAIFY